MRGVRPVQCRNELLLLLFLAGLLCFLFGHGGIHLDSVWDGPAAAGADGGPVVRWLMGVVKGFIRGAKRKTLLLLPIVLTAASVSLLDTGSIYGTIVPEFDTPTPKLHPRRVV